MRAKVKKRLAFVLAAALACTTGAWRDANAGLAQKKNARGKPRPVIYLALGDSTGAGVGAQRGGYVEHLFRRIERVRPGSQVINLCARAAATADILHGQLGRVPNTPVTLITVGVGANDLIRGVPAEQFARNYEEIIVRLKGGTGARILIMNIPDMSLAPAVPAYMREHARHRINAFNGRLEEIARRHKLLVVDLFSQSREFSLRPGFFSQDGLHPSDAGYDFWAGLLWPATQQMIGEQQRQR